MNLACQKPLGQITKEVGFGQTPTPVFSKFPHFHVFLADIPNNNVTVVSLDFIRTSFLDRALSPHPVLWRYIHQKDKTKIAVDLKSWKLPWLHKELAPLLRDWQIGYPPSFLHFGSAVRTNFFFMRKLEMLSGATSYVSRRRNSRKGESWTECTSWFGMFNIRMGSN